MTDEFDFGASQGAEVAKESNKGGGNFAREVEFLKLDATQSGIAQGKHQGLYRFITDAVRRNPNEPMTKYNLAWITVGQHYSATKPRPEYAREGQTWPEKMGAGCRRDKVFAAKFGGSCFLCERGDKPSNRTWALAVEREQVTDGQGQVVGFQDKTREIFDTDEQGNFIKIGTKSDGKDEYQMKTVPAYVVMNMGYKNFFGPLQQVASYHGSLLNGDWVITRSGTGNNDTTYSFIRVGEQRFGADNPFGLAEGTVYDLAIPGLMEAVYPDLPDLRKIIADRVSDDYFGRWFVPGWAPPQKDGQQGGQQGQQVQQQVTVGAGVMASGGGQVAAPVTPQPPKSEEAPSSALDALKARVTGNAGG